METIRKGETFVPAEELIWFYEYHIENSRGEKWMRDRKGRKEKEKYVIHSMLVSDSICLATSYPSVRSGILNAMNIFLPFGCIGRKRRWTQIKINKNKREKCLKEIKMGCLMNREECCIDRGENDFDSRLQSSPLTQWPTVGSGFEWISSIRCHLFLYYDRFFLSYQICTKREYTITTGERAKEKKQ